MRIVVSAGLFDEVSTFQRWKRWWSEQGESHEANKALRRKLIKNVELKRNQTNERSPQQMKNANMGSERTFLEKSTIFMHTGRFTKWNGRNFYSICLNGIFQAFLISFLAVCHFSGNFFLFQTVVYLSFDALARIQWIYHHLLLPTEGAVFCFQSTFLEMHENQKDFFGSRSRARTRNTWRGWLQ